MLKAEEVMKEMEGIKKKLDSMDSISFALNFAVTGAYCHRHKKAWKYENCK